VGAIVGAIVIGIPWGTQVEVIHPGGGDLVLRGSSKQVTKHQIADLQTVKSRYQTGKLAIADWRTGNDWKT